MHLTSVSSGSEPLFNKREKRPNIMGAIAFSVGFSVTIITEGSLNKFRHPENDKSRWFINLYSFKDQKVQTGVSLWENKHYKPGGIKSHRLMLFFRIAFYIRSFRLQIKNTSLTVLL